MANAAPASLHDRLHRLWMHRLARPVLFVLCLLPLGHLAWGAATDALGPNPAEALIRRSGEWTLRLLCATLAVTPLREWTGWSALARWRRMLGLYTAFYACVHFLCYAWLDMGLEWVDIAADIAKRPFILVGALALLLLAPLAATSFGRAMRAMGAANWKALHRAVYAIALLALLHFFWMRAGKNDFALWTIYAAVLGVLLGWRIWRQMRSYSGPVPRSTGARAPPTAG
jgi:sulfoxide reductase heme-binding subunit YedZ